MMNQHNILRYYRLAVAIILLITLGTAALIVPAVAQGTTTPTPSAPINFTGVIQGIDTNSIVVNGLLVNLTATGISPSSLQLGAVVTIAGSLENGVVLASSLVFGTATTIPVNTITPTPTSTPRSRTSGDDRTSGRDDDARPRIIVEGPVRQINIDSVLVFDLTIQVAPENPTFSGLRVGDFIRVEGDFNIINNTFIIVANNITIINVNMSGRDSLDSSRRDSNRPAPPPPPSRDSRSSRSSRSS